MCQMCHAVSLDKELVLRTIKLKESSETFEIWAKILKRGPDPRQSQLCCCDLQDHCAIVQSTEKPHTIVLFNSLSKNLNVYFSNIFAVENKALHCIVSWCPGQGLVDVLRSHYNMMTQAGSQLK